MKLLKSLSAPLAFGIALAGLLGSLYAQHLGYQPCVLCWWQRVFLYPLVLLIPVGIWQQDRKLWLYALPLSVLGGATAFYQLLLYTGVIPETLAPCTIGVSCTQRLPEIFGINLISASLIAFVVITVLLLINRRSHG